MDIDSFIDELEKVCECPNQGYIKCLEKVKELKAENEKLKAKLKAKLREENQKWEILKQQWEGFDDY